MVFTTEQRETLDIAWERGYLSTKEHYGLLARITGLTRKQISNFARAQIRKAGSAPLPSVEKKPNESPGKFTDSVRKFLAIAWTWGLLPGKENYSLIQDFTNLSRKQISNWSRARLRSAEKQKEFGGAQRSNTTQNLVVTPTHNASSKRLQPRAKRQPRKVSQRGRVTMLKTDSTDSELTSATRWLLTNAIEAMGHNCEKKIDVLAILTGVRPQTVRNFVVRNIPIQGHIAAPPPLEAVIKPEPMETSTYQLLQKPVENVEALIKMEPESHIPAPTSLSIIPTSRASPQQSLDSRAKFLLPSQSTNQFSGAPYSTQENFNIAETFLLESTNLPKTQTHNIPEAKTNLPQPLLEESKTPNEASKPVIPAKLGNDIIVKETVAESEVQESKLQFNNQELGSALEGFPQSIVKVKAKAKASPISEQSIDGLNSESINTQQALLARIKSLPLSGQQKMADKNINPQQKSFASAKSLPIPGQKETAKTDSSQQPLAHQKSLPTQVAEEEKTVEKASLNIAPKLTNGEPVLDVGDGTTIEKVLDGNSSQAAAESQSLTTHGDEGKQPKLDIALTTQTQEGKILDKSLAS